MEELEGRIDTLSFGEFGAKWVCKTVGTLKNPAKTPIEITRTLDNLVRQKSGRLTRPRLATEKEIDQLEGSGVKKGPGPYYIDEVIGNVRGIEAMYGENDLRELLTVRLEEKIKEFKEVQIDALQLKDLIRWSKWTQTIENTLASARDAITMGRLLLTRSNLSPLLEKIGSSKDRVDELFRDLLRSLPEN